MSTKTENKGGFIPVIKTLGKSIREYKKPSILAPIFVAIEVVLECLIPFVMTLLLGAMDYITNNPTNPNPISVYIVKLIFGDSTPVLLLTILWFGLGLLLIATLSLLCGALSGKEGNTLSDPYESSDSVRPVLCGHGVPSPHLLCGIRGSVQQRMDFRIDPLAGGTDPH